MSTASDNSALLPLVFLSYLSSQKDEKLIEINSLGDCSTITYSTIHQQAPAKARKVPLLFLESSLL
jgi:hypothetical protein